MRFFLSLLFISAVFAVSADEAAAESWPLWDGVETVEQYAQRVKLPSAKSLDLGGGVKLELVLIPAGKFIMGTPEPEKPIVGQSMIGISGSLLLVLLIVVLVRAWRKHKRPQFSLKFMLALMVVASVGVWGGVRWHGALQVAESSEFEYPIHDVTLTQPFYMGKFTVTQAQYQQVMGTNPSNFKSMDRPVDTVSWIDAQEFCKKMNELTKQAVRLPTEAEWEYACRAGTRTEYYSGDSAEDLKRVAWYEGNSNSMTHSVGQKEPNAFGLYDMHGNVWQWCQDWYEDYSADAVVDPLGPEMGDNRVLRGGSWFYPPMCCRSAYRIRHAPDFRNDLHKGFRVAAPALKTP